MIDQRAMRERNLSLDLLRGVCALGIAVYHYLAWAKDYKLQSLGTFGVYAFFVISALVMMMSYAGGFRSEITLAALKDFFRNRAARILPLLALISIYAAVYYRGAEGLTLTRVVLTASGLFALHMPGLLSMTTGAWSLGIELLFYALFPAICILAANARIVSLIIALAISIIAQQLLLLDLPPSNDPEFWGRYIMPITFAPFFALGLIIWRFPRKVGAANLLVALVLIGLVFVFSAVVPGNLFRGGLPYIALTFATGAAVFFAYRSEVPALLQPLAWFIGEISYSMYLSHWIAFDLSGKLPFQSLRSVWFAVLTIGVASALTFAFERPLRDRLRGRPPASASA